MTQLMKHKKHKKHVNENKKHISIQYLVRELYIIEHYVRKLTLVVKV